MKTIAQQLDQVFRAAIRDAFGIDADPLIGLSQNEKFGDYQSNAAMGLAKQVGEKTGQKTNPRAVAEQIKSKLNLGDLATEVNIAGPGFINVRLNPQHVAGLLQQVGSDSRLAIETVEKPQTVVIDYSAPNIAKEMHVGHIRTTVLGDALSRILSFRGDNVIRQNHLGDWGTQFGRVVLAMWYEAAFARAGQSEGLDQLMQRQQAASASKDGTALAEVVRELAKFHQQFINEDPDGTRFFVPYLRQDTLSLEELEKAYVFVSAVTDTPEAKQVTIQNPNDRPRALSEIPRLVTTFIQNPAEHEQERLAWERARDVTLRACNKLYRQLNVQLADPSIQSQPLERGESFYNRFLPDVVRELREKGIAVESEGAIVVHVPNYEAPLIIQKADGGYLYGTTDLAAVRFRVRELHANRVLYVVGSPQTQHLAQVFWTARQAGWCEGVSLEHASFGTILGEDGKTLRTRAGGVVRLRDVLDEAEQRAERIVTDKNPELPESQRKAVAHAIGIGAVKYADLSKDRTTDYVFSWEKMLAMEGNTAPYLQYAYARIRSIFRKSGEAASDFGELSRAAAGKLKLDSPFEISLAKHILRLGEVLDALSRDLKPHLLTTFLYELATRFSSFYENCPVLQSEELTRSSRLALCDVTARTLALGLDLLGIEHPEQM
jgi:arginyl-tRNA synthetase